MKYISLFAGIGGFDLALDRLGHECVYTNEWDKHAAKIYETRFNRSVDTRDIKTVSTEEIPEHDLLVGGFPCQAFSIAGKRLGFDDTRGTLFFEIARILKDKQPKYFILENVKGLISHNSGQTFRTIISTIAELGYDCQWNVLNSKNFGVPQNRERVYIVGNLRGVSRPEIFPIRTSDSNDTETSEKGDITRTITTTHAHSWGWNISYVINQITNPPHSSQRLYGTDGISPTITTGKKVYISEEPIVHNLQPRNPNRPSLTRLCDCGSGKLYQKCHGTPAGSGHIYKTNGVTYCLDTGNTQGVQIGHKIRRLTEIECERLQGFPDNWTEGISSTQRYKCLGNAVTVNVVYEVARNL